MKLKSKADAQQRVDQIGHFQAELEIIEQEHRILNAWKNVSEKPSADLFIHNYPELV